MTVYGGNRIRYSLHCSRCPRREDPGAAEEEPQPREEAGAEPQPQEEAAERPRAEEGQ